MATQCRQKEQKMATGMQTHHRETTETPVYAHRATHGRIRDRGSIIAGAMWMLVISLVLFWLPLIGPLIGGIVGGKRAGGVVAGIIAAFLPAILVAAFVGVFGALIGLPVIGLISGVATFIAVAGAVIGPLLVGAVIGGLMA